MTTWESQWELGPVVGTLLLGVLNIVPSLHALLIIFHTESQVSGFLYKAQSTKFIIDPILPVWVRQRTLSTEEEGVDQARRLVTFSAD